MTGLSVDITLDLPGFRLAVAHDFASRGLTAVFGPSGSGKSTLLRVIAGLEARARGAVRFDGQEWQNDARHMPPHRRGVGYVFQDARLFPHLTVAGNLDYARRRARPAPGRPAPDREAIIAALDLGPLLPRRVGGLSGGERQRVAIGRALMGAPRLLLMDEPLAALDAVRKDGILSAIEHLRDAIGIPVIYVSHDLHEVARLADDIVILREGRVAAAGSATALLADPGAVRLLGVRDAGAVLPARVVAHHPDGLTELDAAAGRLFLPRLSAEPGARLRVRIAARDVILSRDRPAGVSALNVLEGRITAIRPGEGPGAVVQLRCGNDLLLARITRRSVAALELAEGQRIFAMVKTVSVARGDVGARHAQDAPETTP